MIETLTHLKEKILSLVTDPFLTSDKPNNMKELFDSESLSKQLPYESFDEQTGIFFNTHSAGFVLEASPLVGGDETISKMLESIFEDIIQEGASLQCLLWADHRVEPFLKGWSTSVVNNEIFDEITKQRSAHYLKHQRISPRMFRFIISYSIPYAKKDAFKDLTSVKDKLLNLLRSFTNTEIWRPKDLLQAVGGLVNFSLKHEHIKRNYNPVQGISSQICTGGKMHVNADALNWENKTNAYFKSFRAIDTPQYWSHFAMQNLIGDAVRNGFRINYPFFYPLRSALPPSGKSRKEFQLKNTTH